MSQLSFNIKKVIFFLSLFAINKATQAQTTPTITNFNDITKSYFDASYTIAAPTSNSSGAFTYTSNNSAVATISGTTVTIVGAGTATITAAQAGDATYNSGSVTATLTVNSVAVVTKNGEFSATNFNYVNKNGAIGSDFGVNKNGVALQTKSYDLITTGLIMHLDAGNTSSYPGTGTTWSDLSGNANHGTLINGASYTSANNGVLTFDGVNDSFSTTLSMGDANTSFSWGGFVKVNAPTTNNYFVFGNYTTNGTTPFFAIAFNNSGNNTFLYLRSSTNIATIGSSTNLDLNTWYYIMGVRDAENNQMKLYVNGELIATNTFLGSYDVKSTSNNFDGVKHLTKYLNCNIGQVQFYNRALTTEEIQQNYNALKSRYGL